METEKSNIEYEVVEPKIWKYDKEGDQIEGVLVQKKTDVGPNDANAYYIENEKGIYMVWGTTILDDRMAVVELLDHVRITYKGSKENSRQQPTKIFKVERGKPTTP